MAQALLPLKDLVQAKTRLAGLLGPSERRALAQAMAEDVLSVLAGHPGIARITLVSDDPGADLLVRKYGAECWREQTLGCRGLNHLMQCAAGRLLADGGEGPLIVLHADLPLLMAEDISVVLDEQRALRGLVIGSDRQGGGTNLLAFGASSVPRFQFGAGSCAAHAAGARDSGIPVKILHRSRIALDVDNPADLKCVVDRLHQHPAGNTAGLLLGTPLGSRVALALATMPVEAAVDDDTNRGSMT